jgi:glycosyltransferase involved in cell wall biosynthesis
MASIALDATYAVDARPSGVAVYSRRLIESLAALDTTHHFLLCYRLSRWRRRRAFLRPPSRTGRGPVVSTRLFQQPFTFWLPWEAQLFHSLAQRPPAFRFRTEIVTVFDIFPITGRNYSAPQFQQKFSKLLRQALARAACVITLSEHTAGQLVEHCGVPRAKIRVTPAGVDLPLHTLTREERQRERERLVGPGNEMVLSVGFIQTRKNTLGAVRALQLLPSNYRLVLAGADGYGSEAVYDFIRREGLGSRVSVLGYVAPERLATLYQAASVFLFPSWEEGFGIPVLEAMAHGVPVVASERSSLPEVGGDAAAYVAPEDVEGIAQTIRQVVENEETADAMRRKGWARAAQFPWRRTAEETLRIYDELLRPGQQDGST